MKKNNFLKQKSVVILLFTIKNNSISIGYSIIKFKDSKCLNYSLYRLRNNVKAFIDIRLIKHQ